MLATLSQTMVGIKSFLIGLISFVLLGIGFLALSFDPPGTWESPGDISLYTTTNYLKAIDELIKHFGNKPTFIMGHSRGASISMMGASRNSKIMAYAAVMPAISRESITSKFANVSFRDLPPGGGEKVKKFELPESFHEDEMNYRLTDDLLKYNKPKLIIAGAHDQIIPPNKIRKMFDSLSDPKQFTLIHWDHNYRHSSEKIEEVNQLLKNFLQKYWK